MSKLGYGYALYPGSPSSLPSDISGLGLWLKADAGVDTTTQNFISQIVISGAGTETSNGTYIRNNAESSYFYGPNGNTISCNEDQDMPYAFSLNDVAIGLAYSNNDIRDTSGWYENDGATPPPTSKNTSIPEQFVSEVTLVGAESGYEYLNTTYKRSVGNITPFLSPDGLAISFNSESSNWLTDDTSYYNPSGNFENWVVGPNGYDPVPTGVNIKYSPITYRVNSWADQSANKRNMIADLFIRPCLIQTELNGKPAIDFNYKKYLTASFNQINITGQTTFIVFKFGIFLGNYTRVFSQSDGINAGYQTSGNILPLMRKDGTYDMWCFSEQNSWLVSSPVLENSWNISTTRTGTNGAFSLNSSSVQTFNSSINANISKMRVGAELQNNNYANATDYFNSKIAEVIVYTRSLTDTEIKQVQGYLNAKYAIY
jgi:hypothetical protein